MGQHSRRITAVSAAVTFALYGGALMAQTSSDSEMVVEEVIVTGIKRSLMDAMDTKREAQGVGSQ